MATAFANRRVDAAWQEQAEADELIYPPMLKYSQSRDIDWFGSTTCVLQRDFVCTTYLYCDIDFAGFVSQVCPIKFIHIRNLEGNENNHNSAKTTYATPDSNRKETN